MTGQKQSREKHMVFGTLPHIILHKLAKEPHSGYALMKAIEQDLGKKPSFGSIYPTLEKLTSQELITCKEDGRRKMYTLSQKGKQEMTRFREVHEKIINNMMAESKACCMISGDEINPMLEILDKIKRGEEPFGKVTSSMVQTRDLVFELVKDGTVDKKHKEINKIINDTHKKLKALQKKAKQS